MLKSASKHSAQVNGAFPVRNSPKPPIRHRPMDIQPMGHATSGTATTGPITSATGPTAMQATGTSSNTGSSTSAVMAAPMVPAADPVATPDIPDFSEAGMAEKAEILFAAVKYAHTAWKQIAHFDDIQIMGPIATGGPGCIVGPNFKALMRTQLYGAQLSAADQSLVNIMGDIIGESFDLWQAYVMVPGLMWYPAFAFFPGPYAPPMPNVPTPLASCMSAMSSKIISANDMGMAFKLAMPSPDWENTIFLNKVAQAVTMAFSHWVGSTFVSGVLGHGRIVIYRPPMVPGGPVIDGSVIASPGCLSGGARVDPRWHPA